MLTKREWLTAIAAAVLLGISATMIVTLSRHPDLNDVLQIFVFSLFYFLLFLLLVFLFRVLFTKARPVIPKEIPSVALAAYAVLFGATLQLLMFQARLSLFVVQKFVHTSFDAGEIVDTLQLILTIISFGSYVVIIIRDRSFLKYFAVGMTFFSLAIISYYYPGIVYRYTFGVFDIGAFGQLCLTAAAISWIISLAQLIRERFGNASRASGIALRSWKNWMGRIVFRESVWGSIIFVIIVLMYRYNLLNEIELDAFIRITQFQSMREVQEKNTVVLHLTSPDNNPGEYLGNALKVVGHLQRAGAELVLLELPRLPMREENQKLIQDLNRTNIVVFGVRPEEGKKLLIDDATYRKMKIPWGVYTLKSKGFPWLTSHELVQLLPFGYREGLMGDTIPDVSIRVVQKYVQSEDPIYRQGNNLFVGNRTIPLLEDGSLYSRYDEKGKTTSEISASYGLDSPQLRYEVWKPSGVIVSESLDEFRDAINGKIVLVQWYNFSSADWMSYWIADLYAYSIDNILRGSFITKNNWLALVLSAISIVLSGWFALRLPVPYAIASMVGLWILVFWGGVWLYSARSVLIDVGYPLASIFIAVGIFPAVRLAHERRLVLAEKQSLEEEERKRLTEELRSAHDMQMGLMPSSDPRIDGFEISGVCRAAEEVGGDFYDYVWLDEKKTKLGIAIVDVSGKAMKGAMTAVLTSGMIYREVGSNATPASVLERINKPMYLKTERTMFTAMSFAVIDTKRKTLRFANAGQMEPILVRDGRLKHLRAKGVRLPLGVYEEVKYQEAKVRLLRGDVVMFYTDGIPEAMNGGRELYGFERLEQQIKGLKDETTRAIRESILTDVQQFSGTAKQHDDMTMVILRVL